jgi:hypothetical protein
MRVRRTAPMFTFNLRERFVNGKLPLSTDICGFLAEMFPFYTIFPGFSRFYHAVPTSGLLAEASGTAGQMLRPPARIAPLS